MQIDAALDKVAETDQMSIVRGRIVAENPTDRRVYIVAFWYTVIGYRTSHDPVKSIQNHSDVLHKLRGDEPVTSYGAVVAQEVVAQRRIVWTNTSWWEPKDRTHDEFVFLVPKGRFDYLEMRVRYLHTRFVEDVGPTSWTSGNDGVWEADFTLKPSVTSGSLVWQERTGSGYNWYTTVLVLPPNAKQ